MVKNSKEYMFVRVHAVPHAKKEKMLAEAQEHVYTISVRERAEQNAANKRIRELVAVHYKVPVTKVRMLTGHRSASKLLEIIQINE